MTPADLVSSVLAAAAAFVAALLSSTAGVTGAFLLVPLQVALFGTAGPSVSATNHLYNVLAAPGGFLGYRREGRLFAPLAWLVLAGTVPGILLGVLVRIRYLPDGDRFRPFAGAVLLVLGVLLAVRSILGPKVPGPTCPAGPVVLESLGPRRLSLRFGGDGYSVSVPALVGATFAVGVAGGAYGVGGGVFVSSYLVGLCRLPVHVTAGATMAATFGASCVATVGFWTAAVLGAPGAAPVPGVAIALGVGGIAGAAIGSRLQRRVPGRVIGIGLAAAVLWLAVRWVVPS